jgi:predicted hotdog family 3-hydroxylacyl-ACP dehydratase
MRTLDHAQIASRIPHAADMCLLERVVSWDAQRILCQAISHSSTTNPLRRDGILPATSLIEYAAQAMAVHGSLLSGDASPTAVKQGRLVSVRNVMLQLDDVATVSEPLDIECELLLADSQSSMFSFMVSVQGVTLANGRASVMFST